MSLAQLQPLPRIVLASGSPYRKVLLERFRVPFEVHVAPVDETRVPDEAPQGYVRRLGRAKAEAGAAALAGSGTCPPDGEPDGEKEMQRVLVIFGSDQTAVLGDRLLGKPGSAAANVEQLLRMSGRSVRFWTSLCVLEHPSGDAKERVIPFDVHFRTLERQEIERYVAAEAPWDCAGGFKAEGLGITLFRALEGEDPSALIGLPLIALAETLRDFGLQLP